MCQLEIFDFNFSLLLEIKTEIVMCDVMQSNLGNFNEPDEVFIKTEFLYDGTPIQRRHSLADYVDKFEKLSEPEGFQRQLSFESEKVGSVKS